MDAKFSKSFFWGAAISAYQTEGGNRWSDWWNWEQGGRKIADHTTSGAASDFWNQYKTYVDLAKKAGMNAMRISVEWARVNPKPGAWNEEALAHYAEIVAYMRKQGVEPVVTLWHFTLPQWLYAQGGWLSGDAVVSFLEYVKCVNQAIGDHVAWWITLNEPSVYLYESFILGLWPPEKRFALGTALRIRFTLIQAHKLAYTLLKNDKNHIGIAANLSWDIGITHIPFVNRALEWLPPRGNDWSFLAAIKDQSDYIGFNYYFKQIIRINALHPFQSVSFLSNDPAKSSDLGWEIAPRGIFEVSKRLYRKFRKPILITENGLADAKDAKRTEFIKDHVHWLARAHAEGVPLLGYLHWSLVDNFEWQLGKKPRFGLIEMDYRNMKPLPRPSLWEYQNIIREYTE